MALKWSSHWCIFLPQSCEVSIMACGCISVSAHQGERRECTPLWPWLLQCTERTQFKNTTNRTWQKYWDLIRVRHTQSTECNQLMEGWINGLMEGWKSKMLISTHQPPHIVRNAFRAFVLRECIPDFAFSFCSLQLRAHCNRPTHLFLMVITTAAIYISGVIPHFSQGANYIKNWTQMLSLHSFHSLLNFIGVKQHKPLKVYKFICAADIKRTKKLACFVIVWFRKHLRNFSLLLRRALCLVASVKCMV